MTIGAIVRWFDPAAQRSCSLPSTWSVPVRPRAASSTHEEQRRRGEADDDGGEDQRLRHRVGVQGEVARHAALEHGCRTRAEPAGREDEQVDGVGQQREADDHLEGARPQQQPDAGAGQHADAECER